MRILLFLFALPLVAMGDIYRWTDENGKVHFSDKPPHNVESENISGITKGANVDSSGSERNKLREIFAPATPEEQRYEQQEAASRAREQQAKAKQCTKIERQLKFFQTQRFYWVDEEGNESNATEEERDQQIAHLEALLSQHCR